MAQDNDHAACVNDWLDRAGEGLSTEQQFALFQRGFTAMWQRAHRTLGDVTLTAIVDRVLYSASEQYQFLSVLEVDASGLRGGALADGLRSVHREKLDEALRFVLIDFLTVLGNLTAEILTAALHAELSKVALEEDVPSEDRTLLEPGHAGSNGEGSEP